MRAVKIYDTRHAKKDLRAGRVNPMDASIKKWISLADALYEIEVEMGSSCGLCIAYDECIDCPLKKCSTQKNYKKAAKQIRALRETIKLFIDDLRGLDEK